MNTMTRKNTTQLTSKILLLSLIFNFHFTFLHAQNEIPDSLVVQRIQFIKNTLEKDRAYTKRWWYGWLGAYSTATIGQAAISFTSNEKSVRQDMALGAATTLLGVAGQFISPLIPGKETEQLNTITSTTDTHGKLVIAEKLLSECAIREKLARNWESHAICSAVNMGGGLITWLGFKRSIGAGIGYFVLNTAITEIQIWTQPTLAKRNYKKYQQKYLMPEEGISYLPSVNWYLETYPGGFGIKMVF